MLPARPLALAPGYPPPPPSVAWLRRLGKALFTLFGTLLVFAPLIGALSLLHWAAGAVTAAVGLALATKLLRDESTRAAASPVWVCPAEQRLGPEFVEFEAALYSIGPDGIDLPVGRVAWGPADSSSSLGWVHVPFSGEPLILPFDPLLEPSARGHQSARLVGLRDPRRPECVVFPRKADLFPLVVTPEQLAEFHEAFARAEKERARRFEEFKLSIIRGYVDAHSD